MFGLFKRTKIETWETEFLRIVFSKLSNEIGAELYKQVESGLLKGVLIGNEHIPNFISFTYKPSLSNKFYHAKGEHFKYSLIKVKDAYTGISLSVSIHIAYGMIIGYSIHNNVSKYKFDNSTINIDAIKKVDVNSDDNSKIFSLLTKQEQQLVNENNIYPTIIDDKYYYHLKELEDGDFIGFDRNNIVYRITHDPLEVSPIDRGSLVDIIKN